MHFYQKLRIGNIDINLKEQDVEEVQVTKFLGITLDDNEKRSIFRFWEKLRMILKN